MKLSEIRSVFGEISSAAIGQRFGRVFVLSRAKIAIDLRLDDGRYLYISLEPSAPAIYLIERRLKELERSSGTPHAFHNLLKKYLAGKKINDVSMIDGERIVKFDLVGPNELGEPENWQFVIQLTGRSSNLFLLNDSGHIFASLNDSKDESQSVGSKYLAPPRPASVPRTDDEIFDVPAGVSPSRFFDELYHDREKQRELESKIRAARTSINQKIAGKERLIARLNEDLSTHGDADKWKRFGDLLLANLYTAERRDDELSVTDYFDENTPVITIKGDKDLSISENAEIFFKRYTKARNAKDEIAKRLDATEIELDAASRELERLEAAVAENNLDIIDEIAGVKPKTRETKKAQQQAQSGIRRFRSSDGLEILVGKKAKDNDQLTFRVAASLDTWLHAADYPGSHVVIRNPQRKEIPPATLLQAAELAAFYSKGNTQPKAAVHYTQKKFVNKPRGGAPGLVSLASFKTILVEPQITAEKID